MSLQTDFGKFAHICCCCLIIIFLLLFFLLYDIPSSTNDHRHWQTALKINIIPQRRLTDNSVMTPLFYKRHLYFGAYIESEASYCESNTTGNEYLTVNKQ